MCFSGLGIKIITDDLRGKAQINESFNAYLLNDSSMLGIVCTWSLPSETSLTTGDIKAPSWGFTQLAMFGGSFDGRHSKKTVGAAQRGWPWAEQGREIQDFRPSTRPYQHRTSMQETGRRDEEKNMKDAWRQKSGMLVGWSGRQAE